MRRFVHGVLATNAKPKTAKVIRSKRKNDQQTIATFLPRLISSERPTICIIRRLGGLGDVIMTTPTLKHIKRILPKCHLIYATDLKYADGALGDILKYNPYIDELIDNKAVHGKKFDYSVDITITGLRREVTKTIPPNRIDMFAERIGVDISSDPVPDYIISDNEREWAKEQIKSLKLPEGTKICAIHAKSNDLRRTWPVENTSELGRLLKEEGVHPILFDWSGQKWDDTYATLFLNMKIRLAMAIINECDCLVCPDSGILHLAGALNKKIISIFGSTSAQSRINHYQNTSALQVSLPCSPCWYNPVCLNGSDKFRCFTSITPTMVKEAVMARLHDEKPIEKIQKISITQDMINKPKKVILVKRRFGGFGDITMTLTAIEALAKKYNDAEVHYALPKAFFAAAENAPFINKIIDYSDKLDKETYRSGMIVDISTPCSFYEATRVRQKKKVEKSRVEIFAEALGARSLIPDLRPRYYPTKEEIDWARNFCNKNDKDIIIGMVLRTAEVYRDWPLDNFYKLIEKLRNKDNIKIVLIDSLREYEADGIVDGCGFPFRKSAALISCCDIVVTADTGPLHVAAALEIPTIALFGPIDAGARCKGYSNVSVCSSGLDCIPCWRTNNSPCRKTNTVKGYSYCMSILGVNAVYDRILGIIKEII